MMSKLGLVADHSYCLLSAAKVRDEQGNITQLVKLRNPWESFIWNGKWSKDSHEWTDELKELLKYDEIEDGAFWMEY